MKSLVLSFVCLSLGFSLQAQKYFSKNAKVSFEAGTPIEDIDAVNKSGTVIIDLASGKIESAVLVTGFQFERALMQEHFNENYMESSKFPKAVFKGNMDTKQASLLTNNGIYSIKVTGELTMHGVTKPISTTLDFTVNSGKIKASTVFNAVLEDYKIDIPGIVKDKISKQAKVKVEVDLQPLK
ncbi:MAG: YceI family protein [Saprospiraceae bacterium]